MGHVRVGAHIPGVDWRDAFRRVSDFEIYPTHSNAVREVVILQPGPDVVVSSWKVNLRRGILCWTERAFLFPDEGRIRFEEVDGDVDEFAGSWTVTPAEDGCRAEFVVDFVIGLPTLEEILEPIAEDALVENVQSILQGLLGDGVMLDLVATTGR